MPCGEHSREGHTLRRGQHERHQRGRCCRFPHPSQKAFACSAVLRQTSRVRERRSTDLPFVSCLSLGVSYWGWLLTRQYHECSCFSKPLGNRCSFESTYLLPTYCRLQYSSSNLSINVADNDANRRLSCRLIPERREDHKAYQAYSTYALGQIEPGERLAV